MAKLGERVSRAWDAFRGREPTFDYNYGPGYVSSIRPDRPRLSRNNLKSIVSSVYTQISVDCAAINLRHVRLENDTYKETINSRLNRALTKSANLDQTARAFMRDVVISMLDEGVVGIVPVSTSKDPKYTDSYDIYDLRTGKILEWFPKHVLIEVYNEEIGQRQTLLMEKRVVAIVENPFFSIMNEPNSTAQRLIRVLNQLDRTNESNSAGKLDLIIQLPYSIKSESREKQAEMRRKSVEAQLTGNQLGIAYIDGTEKIVQLNRSVENNLWQQAQELLNDLYNQLGFSQSIFDGTADEKTLLNYYNRTIDPILSEIAEEMERKWISMTAQQQGQAIWYFRDPFKLVPVEKLAEIADKFTRNEIMSSNEIRSVIGMKPSDDPKADELRNSNLNHPDEEGTTSTVVEEVKEE